MSKLYDNLLAPEWRIAIQPTDAGDSVLKGLRIVTGRAASLTSLDLSTETVRPFYSIITVNVGDIEYVNALALDDDYAIVAGALVSGELSGEQFLAFPNCVSAYRFKSDTGNIDAFGLGITSDLAIVGRDFYYARGYYWFKEHPSKFGSIGVSGSDTVLTLPCMGGDLATAEMPLGVAYHNCADYTTVNAIKSAVYGVAPNGVTNELLYAIGGMKLSNSPISQMWEEGGYIIAITEDGEFIYAPEDAGVRFIPGNRPDTGELFGAQDYFLAPTSIESYIISLDTQYTKAELPGIAKDFPQLGDNFFGNELLVEFYKLGCIFYNLKYINNAVGAQRALSNFAVNPGKVIITTTAEAHATIHFNGAPTLPNVSVASTDTAGTTNII